MTMLWSITVFPSHSQTKLLRFSLSSMYNIIEGAVFEIRIQPSYYNLGIAVYLNVTLNNGTAQSKLLIHMSTLCFNLFCHFRWY